MDLHEFNDYKLYFDDDTSAEVEAVLAGAAKRYPTAESEAILRMGLKNFPENFSLLVGIYRFYFYRHKYSEALFTAHKILVLCERKMNWYVSWPDLTLELIAQGVLQHSMSLVRLYLTTLKCAGYVNIRMSNFTEGISMLEKVIELDTHDRLSTRDLLATVTRFRPDRELVSSTI